MWSSATYCSTLFSLCRTAGEVCGALVSKGISATRQKTKEKAMEILLMYIEIEKQDIFQVRTPCFNYSSVFDIAILLFCLSFSGGSDQRHASQAAESCHRINSNYERRFAVRTIAACCPKYEPCWRQNVAVTERRMSHSQGLHRPHFGGRFR